jgi:hypothetical protein
VPYFLKQCYHTNFQISAYCRTCRAVPAPANSVRRATVLVFVGGKESKDNGGPVAARHYVPTTFYEHGPFIQAVV